MNGIAVIKAIKQIYPGIKGGFSYWEKSPHGTAWAYPWDGLIWTNTEYHKPDWSVIMEKINKIGEL